MSVTNREKRLQQDARVSFSNTSLKSHLAADDVVNIQTPTRNDNYLQYYDSIRASDTVNISRPILENIQENAQLDADVDKTMLTNKYVTINE